MRIIDTNASKIVFVCKCINVNVIKIYIFVIGVLTVLNAGKSELVIIDGMHKIQPYKKLNILNNSESC